MITCPIIISSLMPCLTTIARMRGLDDDHPFDIQPIVLISQADKEGICPQLRANPMGTYPEVEEMRQKVSTMLNMFEVALPDGVEPPFPEAPA